MWLRNQYTGSGGGAYTGPGGGCYSGPGVGMYTGPGGGLYTGPGGGLYTGPGGGLYAGPGGGLYAGPGGGMYAGPDSTSYMSNIPPWFVLIEYLEKHGMGDVSQFIRANYASSSFSFTTGYQAVRTHTKISLATHYAGLARLTNTQLHTTQPKNHVHQYIHHH